MRRGLVSSRGRAQEEIDAGHVLVAGAPADRAARLVAPGEPVHITGTGARFVSRGGDKLDGALEAMGVDVAGRRCLDAGSSTGGFTDCLLQRGAASVVAVDVGHGIVHPRVGTHPRVTLLERTNVRDLSPADLAALGQAPVSLLVADLSFISLRTVAPALTDVTAPGGDLVLLVKPQFEAGRAMVSQGRGVIRDPEVRRRAVDEVVAVYAQAGASLVSSVASSLTGAKGNVEIFVHLARAASD